MYNDKIYLFGGDTGNDFSDRIIVYDPTTGYSEFSDFRLSSSAVGAMGTIENPWIYGGQNWLDYHPYSTNYVLDAINVPHSEVSTSTGVFTTAFA